MCLLSYHETRNLMTFEPLSTFIQKAIIAVVVSASLSIFAFMLMVLRIVREAIVSHTSRPQILFFRTQLGYYSACLILSNMFISAAGLIDICWLTQSGLTPGLICLSQAVLMQIGVWGTCWFTVAHGVHTLISLVFCVRQVYWHSAVVITIGWVIAFVAAFVPLAKGEVYGPAGTSCSITLSYPNDIIFLGALPIILGTFLTTAIYSVTFVIWHRKHSVNHKRNMHASGLAFRRVESRPAEYHKFINMIIWTMFWFPLAFVFLMLPFCITRILVHAGLPISPLLHVLADACASILGFVNVVLVFNTLRVLSHLTRAARIARETMTFGHDAPSDSPKDSHFRSRSDVSSSGSHRTCSSTQPSHSHSSSYSSADSGTGLICAEKMTYARTQIKAAPLAVHILPPAELGRQLDSSPNVTSPSHMVNINLSPPPVDCETGATRHKPLIQDEKYLFEPIADINPFEKAEESSFRPGIPLKVDLSSLPIRPPPLSHPATGKPAASATRLGVPAPSSDIIPAAFMGRKNAGETTRRVSSISSYASTGTLGTDTDSDCSGELMHAYKIRLNSQVFHPGDDEEVFRGSLHAPPQRRSMWARRMTMDTIWSQESGNMTEDEIQEAYWQLISELLGDLGAETDDQADGVGGITRQSTFGPRDARPVTLRVQPRMRSGSKSSVHFADTGKSSRTVCT